MKCETCETDNNLLACAFGDCVLAKREPFSFCPEDMVEHLETAHKDNAGAQEMAQQIRACLKESEAGLLSLSKLTGYQTTVYVGLTQAVQPPYSDIEALELIEKYSQMIAERERRRFEPYATAKAIQDTESSARSVPRMVIEALLQCRTLLSTLKHRDEADQGSLDVAIDLTADKVNAAIELTGEKLG